MKKKPVTIHCIFSSKIEDLLRKIDVYSDIGIKEELYSSKLDWYEMPEDFSSEVTLKRNHKKTAVLTCDFGFFGSEEEEVIKTLRNRLREIKKAHKLRVELENTKKDPTELIEKLYKYVEGNFVKIPLKELKKLIKEVK